MSEVTEQYRIVCHGSGQPGHADHVFIYTDLKSAIKMRVKRSEEWSREKTTMMCAPFHLEKRQISAWEEADNEGEQVNEADTN